MYSMLLSDTLSDLTSASHYFRVCRNMILPLTAPLSPITAILSQSDRHAHAWGSSLCILVQSHFTVNFLLATSSLMISRQYHYYDHIPLPYNPLFLRNSANKRPTSTLVGKIRNLTAFGDVCHADSTSQPFQVTWAAYSDSRHWRRGSSLHWIHNS